MHLRGIFGLWGKGNRKDTRTGTPSSQQSSRKPNRRDGDTPVAYRPTRSVAPSRSDRTETQVQEADFGSKVAPGFGAVPDEPSETAAPVMRSRRRTGTQSIPRYVPD